MAKKKKKERTENQVVDTIKFWVQKKKKKSARSQKFRSGYTFQVYLSPAPSFYRQLMRFRESCAGSHSQWQDQHLTLYHNERLLLHPCHLST